jgi:hypothetical protein
MTPENQSWIQSSLRDGNFNNLIPALKGQAKFIATLRVERLVQSLLQFVLFHQQAQA